MGKIVSRPETNRLFFDFRFNGIRCREQTTLLDTPANRKKLQKILDRIEAEMTLGTFEYARYFPESNLLHKFNGESANDIPCGTDNSPTFEEFAEQWFTEMKIQWKRSHTKSIRITLNAYLIPAFREQPVNLITKTDILAFRAKLAEVPGQSGKGSLSASRINHIMGPLRMILNEAADRFHFNTPYRGIKSLKVPRSEVYPLSLDEVQLFIRQVRPDFRNYFIVRFFTGMRTAEIDGLKWKYVDFNNRLILIRETIVEGHTEYTKNNGSQREIQMSRPVYDALVEQKTATEKISSYVFCNNQGNPVDRINIMNRIWYPTLKRLGLERRRPYQTRHTAATLWLAAGENPEWIARQMGHTTTEMLFRVYSRYVPNLTRRDGSAMERLLSQVNQEGNDNETNK